MAFKPTNLLGLAKTLRQLSAVPARASKRFAEWVDAEMQRNYTAAVNPYGGAHAPLKASTIERKMRRGTAGAGILRDSFAMMNTTTAAPLAGAGVLLRVEPPYAVFHIKGTKHMDPREIFPIAGMPAKWRRELERIVAEEFSK